MVTLPKVEYFRLACAAILFTAAPSVAAQTVAPEVVKALNVIDVPFTLGEIEPGERADTLWVKGKQPDNLLLARFSIRPVQAAVLVNTPLAQATGVLWRAFPGPGKVLQRKDELSLENGPRTFCGSVANERALACFIDEDGNGSFERIAEAIPEQGRKPYHVTIIKAPQALPLAVAYKILPDEQRPAVTIELRNCAKDYDYPRFTALSKDDGNASNRPLTLGWFEKNSSFAPCRRGKPVSALSQGTATAPIGGYLAQIGPLAFTVGPKQQPALALLGPADPGALYRLEGASLVDTAVGRTPNQAQLLALKRFPYPMIMAQAGASVHDSGAKGALPVGGRVATVPFHHAYRGFLKQDVSISTLFGKRSLAAGTVVYGFAARSRITATRGGFPLSQAVGDEEFRTINLQLTWCAPVQGKLPVKEAPNAMGRNGWSGACIPQSTVGTHTIITDLQPAFAVSGVSYGVETSSNDGPAPVQRDDDVEFEKPLRIDTIYEGRSGEFIALREQIYFGDELSSSRPNKLYAPAGTVLVEIAGIKAELTAKEDGSLDIKPTGDVVIGSNPVLQWDQNAYMLQQLQKLGLKVQNADGDGAAEPAAAESAAGQGSGSSAPK